MTPTSLMEEQEQLEDRGFLNPGSMAPVSPSATLQGCCPFKQP